MVCETQTMDSETFDRFPGYVHSARYDGLLLCLPYYFGSFLLSTAVLNVLLNSPFIQVVFPLCCTGGAIM
jgi:hypothetical protein